MLCNKITIYSFINKIVPSAILIIRISGINVVKVMHNICNKTLIPRYTNLILIKNLNEEIIDKCIGFFLPAPHSSTGEDYMELHVHGLKSIINKLTILFKKLNIFQAKAGEFSKRSLYNKKIDVKDIINMSNLLNLKFNINNKLNLITKKIRLELINLELNYYKNKNNKNFSIKLIYYELDNFIKNYNYKVNNIILIGKPNIGKSFLFNKLINENYSIISNISGTTINCLGKKIKLLKYNVEIYDTAGIEITKNPLKYKGLEKTYLNIKNAKIILFLNDFQEKRFFLRIKNNCIIILIKTKIDFMHKINYKNNYINVSSYTYEQIYILKTKIEELIYFGKDDNEIFYKYLKLIYNKIGILIKQKNDNLKIILLNKIYNLLTTIDKNKNPILNNLLEKFCIGK